MRLGVLASVALCACSAAAHADSFVYTVSDHFPVFSVVGTITTDKDTGVLNLSDITDFNLTLSDFLGVGTITPSTTDRDILFGQGLTASPAGLFFDYTAPSAVLLLENTTNGNSIEYESFTAGNPLSSGENISVEDYIVHQDQTGNVEIATATTPEPSSIALLGTGILGIAGVVRRRVHSGGTLS